MSIRRIAFETPLGGDTPIDLGSRGRLPASEAARLPADELVRHGVAPLLVAQLGRLGLSELVLPGADRWLEAALDARPSDPAWIPGLAWNARVVQLELARDALADPWQPGRNLGDLSVLGAASEHWRAGEVEFDVLEAPLLTPRRYKLSERERHHLWRHLTGLLDSMALERGQVRPAASASAEADRAAVVGMRGLGLRACFVAPAAEVSAVEVREDGRLRLDQWARTALAEDRARLLRRWRAEVGPPVVLAGQLDGSIDDVGGRDDLSERVGGGRAALAMIGVGSAAALGAAAAHRSPGARRWVGAQIDRIREVL